VRVYYETAFEADPAAIEGHTYAGIDVVSVANNHAFNYSRATFEDCLARLSAAGKAPLQVLARGRTDRYEGSARARLSMLCGQSQPLQPQYVMQATIM
jgi:hypothetical protein